MKKNRYIFFPDLRTLFTDHADIDGLVMHMSNVIVYEGFVLAYTTLKIMMVCRSTTCVNSPRLHLYIFYTYNISMVRDNSTMLLVHIENNIHHDN